MPKSEVQIDFKKFQAVLARLERRITQRFADGSEPGLLERMKELAATASAAPKARRKITSPLWLFRLVLAGAIVFLGCVGYQYAGEVKLSFKDSTLSDILQAADSAKNLVLAVLMLIGSMFLWERSWKRSIASRYLDQLIALGHVINVAQMSKDPERLTYSKEQITEASPDLGGCTTPFLLGRWLDYANDMVIVLPTLAAYVSAGVTDSAIQAKKDEVQSVADSASANLRQKVSTLATLFPATQKEEPASTL